MEAVPDVPPPAEDGVARMPHYEDTHPGEHRDVLQPLQGEPAWRAAKTEQIFNSIIAQLQFKTNC